MPGSARAHRPRRAGRERAAPAGTWEPRASASCRPLREHLVEAVEPRRREREQLAAELNREQPVRGEAFGRRRPETPVRVEAVTRREDRIERLLDEIGVERK